MIRRGIPVKMCRWVLFLLGAVISAVGLLMACGTTDPVTPSLATPSPTGTATLEVTATPIPTIVPSATPTLDMSRKYGGWPPDELAYNPTVQAVASAAMQRHQAVLTVIALTPTLLPMPRADTPTPAPTPTLGVGMIADEGCFVPMGSGKPVFPSCWNAQVTGQWLLVAVGWEGDSLNLYSDWPLEGLLWVSTNPYVHPPSRPEFYDAPRTDLHIVALDGTQVILASRDPAVQDTFVFDLVTRQWIAPTPAPVPPL